MIHLITGSSLAVVAEMGHVLGHILGHPFSHLFRHPFGHFVHLDCLTVLLIPVRLQSPFTVTLSVTFTVTPLHGFQVLIC